MLARRVFRSILLFSLPFLPLGIAIDAAFGQGLQRDEQSESVHGIVINAVTGGPVPRALVHSLDERFAMLTDGGGHFEFTVEGAASGSTTFFTAGANPTLVRGSRGSMVWLEARKPGFLRNVQEQGSAAGNGDGEITLALIPEAIIQGRIALSTGEPALGVTAELFVRQVREGAFRWEPRGSAQANSNGEFRFADLPAGSYKLVTRELLDNDPVTTVPGGQMYGFAPVYFPGVADFDAAGSIELSAGQTVEADLSLTHQPYYPVKIPVADAVEGGVNVIVSLQGKRGPGYSLGYSPEKREIQGLLPSGNYTVEAITYGPGSGTGTVNLRVAGSAAEGPAVSMVRNSSLVVDVKEEFSDTKWTGSSIWNDGKHSYTMHGPRSYLFVRAEPVEEFGPPSGAALRPPSNAQDESIVLENLAPGRYWVQVNSQRGYAAAATAGGVDLLREPLVVGSGSSIPIQVRMRDDFAQLEGKVAGVLATQPVPEGPGMPTGWLYCVPLPDSPGRFEQVAIAADGTFGTLTLPPGGYHLLAFSQQQRELPFRDAEAMKAYDGKGELIHLTEGQKASVQLQLMTGQ